jgi:RNA polymerase sigma-70 factor, ECF subfamily
MDGPNLDPSSPKPAAEGMLDVAALYDRYGERLYRTALGMLGRREDAEDAVQDVFAAMLQARPSAWEDRDFTAYLFAALRRAAGRSAARRARAPALSESAVDGAAARPPAPCEYASPYGERLQAALLALPAEQRETVALKIDGGLTFAEVSHVLGISSNTAASRYRYALEKLRSLMAEHAEGDLR